MYLGSYGTNVFPWGMATRRPVKKRGRYASLQPSESSVRSDIFEVDELSDDESDSDWREEDCETDDVGDDIDDDDVDENPSQLRGNDTAADSYCDLEASCDRGDETRKTSRNDVNRRWANGENDHAIPCDDKPNGNCAQLRRLNFDSCLSGSMVNSPFLHAGVNEMPPATSDELFQTSKDCALPCAELPPPGSLEESFEQDELDTSSYESSAISSLYSNDEEGSSDDVEDPDLEENTNGPIEEQPSESRVGEEDENHLTTGSDGDGIKSVNDGYRGSSQQSCFHRDRKKDIANEGGEEYARFLAAILAEDSPPSANPRDPYSSLLDDDVDADFDYLTAVAELTEDPLEYRNDKAVHVSRREIVQLVSGVPTRRRRHRKTNHVIVGNANTLPVAVPGAPLRWHPQGSTSIFDATRHWNTEFQDSTTSNNMSVARPFIAAHCADAAIPVAHMPVADPAAQLCYPQSAYNISTSRSYKKHKNVGAGASLLAPRPVAQIPLHAILTPGAIAVLQYQLNLQVVMLANVHVFAEDSNSKDHTASLLRQLVQMRDISREYKNMFEPLRRTHELPLHSSIGTQPPVETYFAAPAVDLVEAFLADAASGQCIPKQLLERFYPFAPLAVHRALMQRAPPPKYSRSFEAELPWTVEDDLLLAMTVSKHTVDFGEDSKDLLPHRDTGDCERRMRYLSSRRCSDNPVKRQVHIMTTNLQPLSRDEIELVKFGLEEFAGLKTSNETDKTSAIGKREVWKFIQRDLLPHRDWRQLEKTWGWRESRRKYKKNARHKRPN